MFLRYRDCIPDTEVFASESSVLVGSQLMCCHIVSISELCRWGNCPFWTQVQYFTGTVLPHSAVVNVCAIHEYVGGKRLCIYTKKKQSIVSKEAKI